MQFSLFPTLEQSCPNVRHCPHLGDAAIGTLVGIANHSGDTISRLYKLIDAERKHNEQLVEANLRLEKELGQAKLELKLERQNKFATNQQKEEEDSADDAASDESSATNEPKKRGAPVGHTGWFRPTPMEYDWLIAVPAPTCCPHCNGKVIAYPSLPPVDLGVLRIH